MAATTQLQPTALCVFILFSTKDNMPAITVVCHQCGDSVLMTNQQYTFAPLFAAAVATHADLNLFVAACQIKLLRSPLSCLLGAVPQDYAIKVTQREG
jgi:hypothetical protein